MTHFGIICPALTGHLNPMTALGYELKQRGHRVTVIGVEDARQRVLEAKLEFQAIGKLDFPKGTTKKLWTQIGNLDGFKAIVHTIDTFNTIANIVLRDTPEIVKKIGVEALLVDQSSAEGGTVAEYLNIPFISVCNALMLNVEKTIPPFISSWNYDPSWRGILRNQLSYMMLDFLGKPLKKVLNEYRQEWNLPTLHNPNKAFSQLAQISQEPYDFEFPRRELPLNFHFTGPLINSHSRKSVSFPYEKLTGQPLIYASLGTLQNRLLWIFEAIAIACAELDAQLVISLGGGTAKESLSNFSGNNIVVNYAPQLEILQKATLCITHAGLNTVLESLSCGVPMVAIPITNDQPGVAARITWTGTGEFIPLSRINVEKLSKTIKKVLTENSYKQNALRLQAAIEQAGGVILAADIIEQTILAGKSVLI
ncbi:MAG: glycosyltransferase [Xenococcaceae cyanobacterium]